MFALKDYTQLRHGNRLFSRRDFFNKRVMSLSAMWIGALCVYHIQLQRQRLLSLRNLVAENEFLSWTECPAAIELAKGLYSNDDDEMKETDDGDEALQNMVLLTAANLGYYPMLQTWESYASAANLKWAVLSLDEWVVQHHKGVNTIPTHPEFFESHSQRFSSTGYHKLGCNKWRSVLSILERCQVDIVFSDVDNLFLQNPFGYDSDLGQKLRSPDHYDYIYSTTFPLSEPSQTECGSDFPKNGNTGFYFIRHDNADLKDAIRRTLSVCREKNFRLHDEAIFWNIVRDMRRDQDWYHCKSNSSDPSIMNAAAVSKTTEENSTTATTANDMNHRTVPKFCCMDPNQNKIDRRYNLEGINNYEQEVLTKIKLADPNVKSFHVNSGRRKINNLLQAGLYQKSKTPNYDLVLQQWQQPEEVIDPSISVKQQKKGDESSINDEQPQQEQAIPLAIQKGDETMTRGTSKEAVMPSDGEAMHVDHSTNLQSENENLVVEPLDVEAAIEDALLEAKIQEAVDEFL